MSTVKKKKQPLKHNKIINALYLRVFHVFAFGTLIRETYFKIEIISEALWKRENLRLDGMMDKILKRLGR